jgi:hypothetical protein
MMRLLAFACIVAAVAGTAVCVMATTYALLSPERTLASGALSLGCVVLAVVAWLATRRGIALARGGRIGAAALVLAVPVAFGLGYLALLAGLS